MYATDYPSDLSYISERDNTNSDISGLEYPETPQPQARTQAKAVAAQKKIVKITSFLTSRSPIFSSPRNSNLRKARSRQLFSNSRSLIFSPKRILLRNARAHQFFKKSKAAKTPAQGKKKFLELFSDFTIARIGAGLFQLFKAIISWTLFYINLVTIKIFPPFVPIVLVLVYAQPRLCSLPYVDFITFRAYCSFSSNQSPSTSIENHTIDLNNIDVFQQHAALFQQILTSYTDAANSPAAMSVGSIEVATVGLISVVRASDHPCRLALEDALAQLVKAIETLGSDLHDWTEKALAINEDISNAQKISTFYIPRTVHLIRGDWAAFLDPFKKSSADDFRQVLEDIEVLLLELVESGSDIESKLRDARTSFFLFHGMAYTCQRESNRGLRLLSRLRRAIFDDPVSYPDATVFTKDLDRYHLLAQTHLSGALQSLLALNGVAKSLHPRMVQICKENSTEYLKNVKMLTVFSGMKRFDYNTRKRVSGSGTKNMSSVEINLGL